MKRAFLAALVVASPLAAQQSKPDWAAFDKFVAQAQKDWRRQRGPPGARSCPAAPATWQQKKG